MLKGIHPGCLLLWIFPEKEEGGVIFEKEINIYAKDAILKRFQANKYFYYSGKDFSSDQRE